MLIYLTPFHGVSLQSFSSPKGQSATIYVERVSLKDPNMAAIFSKYISLTNSLVCQNTDL